VDEVEVDIEEAFAEAKKAWWLLALLGVISVGLGAVLIFWPGRTLTVVATIVGLFMLIAGVIRFFVAVFDSGANDRWLMAIAGIIGIVLGIVVMKNPEATIKLIVLITAIFWLISGLVDMFRGLTNNALPDRGIRIGFGALAVFFAVIVLFWPGITIGVFAIVVGVYTVLVGVLEIVAAFQIKNA
jgi:uncharacterized membrane protein HdeD (DUF308 family)